MSRTPTKTRPTPRRVLFLGLFSLEGLLYSSIAPLVPHFDLTLHLSAGSTGVLVASYNVGLITGALGAGKLVDRRGPHSAILSGLAILAAACVAFGLSGTALGVDCARACQGLATGLIWVGALVWLMAATAENERGALLGLSLGAGMFGGLLGPVIGTAAVVVGAGSVFDVVAGIAVVMGACVWRCSAPVRESQPTGKSIRSALARPCVLIGLWLVLLPAGAMSLVTTLIPIRLAAFGASAVEVGAVFLATAALGGAMAPVWGRMTDRVGPARVSRTALILAAPVLIALAAVHAAWCVGLLTVIAGGAVLGACVTPGMTWLTQATHASQLSMGTSAMLLNLSFSAAEALGAPAGARVAQLTSDEVAFALLAGMCVMTALGLHGQIQGRREKSRRFKREERC